GQINGGRVQAVNCSGGFVIKPQTALGNRRHHEKHQQGAHAVVAEALPHFGKKQRSQAGRVAEKRALPRYRHASLIGLVHENFLCFELRSTSEVDQKTGLESSCAALAERRWPPKPLHVAAIFTANLVKRVADLPQ